MRKNLTMFRDTYLNNVYGLLTDKFEFYALIGMTLFDIGEFIIKCCGKSEKQKLILKIKFKEI